jgi:crotonobetainyl-CoA:carnitine CoA-transferase CaiB-like acyl-CoA transferase
VGRAEFATNPLRTANRAAVDQELGPAFHALTVAEAIARLDAAGVAWGRLTEVRDLGRHPALRRVEGETDLGALVTLPRPAGRDSAFRPGPVPALGSHTDAIRREFGRG